MKSYYSLGLMSGTSMDGVDVSIIQSDGETKYRVILDKYFEYPEGIYEKLSKLRDKVSNSYDNFKKLSKKIKSLEKEITLFYAEAVNKILKDSTVNINLIGFHGQTIFHSPYWKISKQLADGKLLSKLTKKTVVYNFRENDIKNGGEGAPLTPIFHKLLADKMKIALPVVFLNIGGIANITYIPPEDRRDGEIVARDIGPGNYLIDQYLKKKSKYKYDKGGKLAKSGKIAEGVSFDFMHWKTEHEKRGESYNSLDINDPRLKPVFFNDGSGLSLEDGTATITEYTSKILSHFFSDYLGRRYETFAGSGDLKKIILCGGGRKNKFLLNSISEKVYEKLVLIDKYGIDGDFVESQAFAYLAIRSYLKLPISFPSTTGVSKSCSGGVIVNS
tara:strand:- start:2008 stop:3171 length:1164 start_codon:yes stop_codon:yes gene_type:complete